MSLRVAVSTVLLLAFAAPVAAQDELPAGPSVSAKAKRSKLHKAVDKPAKPAAAQAPEPWRVVDPDRAAKSAGDPDAAAPKASNVERRMKPVDQIEIGGKWSGNNDTAEKTRVQNYNGDAVGTGGEVGFKLHF